MDCKLLFRDAAYYLAPFFAKYIDIKGPEAPPPRHIPFDNDKAKTDEARALLLACYLNDASVCLKLELYREAETACSKAIELEPKSLKALYRRGQCNVRLGEFEQACARGRLHRARLGARHLMPHSNPSPGPQTLEQVQGPAQGQRH
jgi:tetratricopeptide (TPR) repeat protein